MSLVRDVGVTGVLNPDGRSNRYGRGRELSMTGSGVLVWCSVLSRTPVGHGGPRTRVHDDLFPVGRRGERSRGDWWDVSEGCGARGDGGEVSLK